MSPPALGSVLKSLNLPGAYPTLGVDGDRVYVGSGVAGSPWTLYALDRDLNLLSERQGGSNPAGGPQLLAPGRLVYWEQDVAAYHRHESADGGASWRHAGDTMPGNVQARDGHILSFAGGAVEYDGERLDPFNGQNGAARIAGDWLVVQDHTNTRLARRAPGGTWRYRSFADGILSSMVCPDGTALAGVPGRVMTWTSGDDCLDASLANWTDEGCGDASGPNHVVTCHYDAATSRFFVFVRPLTAGAAITLERFHDASWARLRRLTDTSAVLVTYAPPPFGRQIVLDVVDLSQPMSAPDAPLREPVPVNPPAIARGDDAMSEEQFRAIMAKLGAIEGRLDAIQGTQNQQTDLAQTTLARVTDAPITLSNRYLGTASGRLNPKPEA
jgi:hypothetical protein